MKYLKLFEAAIRKKTNREVLTDIRLMITNDDPKEKVLKYISRFLDNDYLNQLRILLDNIHKDMMNFEGYISESEFLDTKPKSIKVVDNGDGTFTRFSKNSDRGWFKYREVKYYFPDEDGRFRDCVRISKSIYESIISNNDVSKNVILVFNQIFEILESVIETANERREINRNYNSPTQKRQKMELIMKLPYDNEVLEVRKLIVIAKNYILRTINSE